MKQIGKFSFPDPSSATIVKDIKGWKETFVWKALHYKVLAVAKTRIEGKWSAYCFPVPGVNHDNETYLWKKEGSKLEEKIALAIFPQFEGIPYAR